MSVQFHGTGRRKTSTASVWLIPATEQRTIEVNGRSFEEYFPIDVVRKEILKPLMLTNTLENFSIKARIRGGGTTGQAEAMRLGIARALVHYDGNFKEVLRAAGLLTRDPRMVERKKYGRKKARKRFQFSKR